MDDPSFGQEWGPLIAAGFSGIAAWVSAVTARRVWRDAHRPGLTAQLVAPPGEPLQMHVRNFGSGAAKQAAFYVVWGEEFASGFFTPDGFLGPGERMAVAMDFDPRGDVDEAKWVVLCLDREDRIFVWPRAGKPKVYPRWTRRKVRTIAWHFDRIYGRSTRDADLRQVHLRFHRPSE
jgi:hypothetical protein